MISSYLVSFLMYLQKAEAVWNSEAPLPSVASHRKGNFCPTWLTPESGRALCMPMWSRSIPDCALGRPSHKSDFQGSSFPCCSQQSAFQINHVAKWRPSDLPKSPGLPLDLEEGTQKFLPLLPSLPTLGIKLLLCHKDGSPWGVTWSLTSTLPQLSLSCCKRDRLRSAFMKPLEKRFHKLLQWLFQNQIMFWFCQRVECVCV